MNIEEFYIEEPFDKLVSTYIEVEHIYDKASKSESKKKQIQILNSIIISIATKKNSIANLWKEIKYCLQVNSSDRDCLRRGAQLLTEVLRRNSNSISQTSFELILEIVKLACEKAFITVCGNDFIALIQYITSKISLKANEIGIIIQKFILSTKLQVNSYRQETRLCLYKIILRLLHSETKSQGLLEKSVQAGEGQKDPRNIGAVFQLYLKSIQIFPYEKLLSHRAAMYENIQAYYPIQFVGDEDNTEHKKVNFLEISSLLDQCLCHPFFAEQTWQLLSSKTAAPPLAPFIPTLLNYFDSIRENKNLDIIQRLPNLLRRFSQEEFIAEEYQEHASLNLSIVIQRIIDVIFCRQDHTFDLQSYKVVKSWLDDMINKVTKGQCHHSGTMMGIFRSLINKSKTTRFRALIEIIRITSLRAILKTINDGEVIPKLGLSIVVVSDVQNPSEDVEQLIGLLVLKVGNLYPTVSDQIKLLLLKILLQVYKSSQKNRSMVRRVNNGFILNDILSKAQEVFANCPNQNQGFIVKAYIDFVATVYVNEIDLLLQKITGTNFELQVYLLGRLWELFSRNTRTQQNIVNGKKIIQKFNELLKNLSTIEEANNLMKGLKVLDKVSLRQLMISADWKRQPQFKHVIFLVLTKIKSQIDKYEFGKDNLNLIVEINSELTQNIVDYYLNKGKDIKYSNQQLLWQSLGAQSHLTFPLLAQINKYEIDNKIYDEFIDFYPPTFIHWYWQRLKSVEDSDLKRKRLNQVLKCLPEPLMLKDKHSILQLVLKDSNSAASLLKIARHIEIDKIQQTGILQFCLSYLEKIEECKPQDPVERSTAIIATLISIAERDKMGNYKKTMIKKAKILNKLKLHRKRLIRQAVRRLSACLQQ